MIKLVEQALQKVYAATECIDNALSEMIVQTFEDQLLEDLRNGSSGRSHPHVVEFGH